MIRGAFWMQAFHLLLALALPVVLTLLVGCLKATAKQEDLGPQVPNDIINKILDQATVGGNPHALKIGQYVDFINTRRIQTADLDTTLGSHRIEVIDQKDEGAQTHFTIMVTDQVRDGSHGFQKIVTQDGVDVKKLVPMFAARATSVRALAASARATFHHLQEGDELMDAPEAVKSRPGCLGLPNCQIPVHTVHFDLVSWQEDGSYKKTTLDLGFAKLTPFIPYGSGMQQLPGALVSDCRAAYVQVGDVPVFVRDCMTLDDFQN